MSKRAKILIIVLAVVLLSGLTWRLMPRALSDVISVNAEAVTSLSCAAMVHSNVDGVASTDSAVIPSVTAETAAFQAIMEILNDTGYRPDVRNLLPWRTTSVRGTGGTGSTVTLMLVWGETAEECCSMTVLDHKTISVSSGMRAGLLVFHPSNRDTLDALIDCVRLYGAST